MDRIELLETRVKRLEELVNFDFFLAMERKIQKLEYKVFPRSESQFKTSLENENGKPLENGEKQASGYSLKGNADEYSQKYGNAEAEHQNYGEGYVPEEEVRKVPYVFAKDMKNNTLLFAGKYKTKDGSSSSTFAHQQVDLEDILTCDSFEMAKVINAFASEERINIIKSLLTSKKTARQLMEDVGFSTTGKLYHHLSFLEKLGIIFKNDDYFIIEARYMACIMLMFTATEKIIRYEGNLK